MKGLLGLVVLLWWPEARTIPIELMPHGFVAHELFPMRGPPDEDTVDVEIAFTEAQPDNLVWYWTRFSCSGELDIYKKLEDGTEKLFEHDVPIRLSKKGNDYRVMKLRHYDCEDASCIFILRIKVFDECNINVYCERGLLLDFAEPVLFPASSYFYGNSSSLSQLYAVQPLIDDFPLTITVEYGSDSLVELQHAWGLDATVYKSRHYGSFRVAIPGKRDFQEDSLVYIWVAIGDQSEYTLDVTEFYNPEVYSWSHGGVNLIILLCLAFVILIGTCVRWAFRGQPGGNLMLHTFHEPPRTSLTQRELVKTGTLLRIDCLEGSSDPTCSICLEDFNVGDKIRRLHCEHDFHVPCIDKWLLEEKRVCPLCNQDVGEAQNFHSPPASPRFATTPSTVELESIENDSISLIDDRILLEDSSDGSTLEANKIESEEESHMSVSLTLEETCGELERQDSNPI